VKYYNKWPASADVIPYTSITYKEIGSITSFQPQEEVQTSKRACTKHWSLGLRCPCIFFGACERNWCGMP